MQLQVGDRFSDETGEWELTAATTMYREMDMRFWLEQAEAEVRALG
jgi:hypothetical protein